MTTLAGDVTETTGPHAYALVEFHFKEDLSSDEVGQIVTVLNNAAEQLLNLTQKINVIIITVSLTVFNFVRLCGS